MTESRTRVAGLRFRNAGKIHYYDAAGLRLEPGEYVVVETTRGPEVAKVVISPDQVVVNELNEDDLRPILRLATDHDIYRADELRTKAEELLPDLRRLADEARFPARIDGAEFTLDGRRLSVAFTSEERLDYRDFVRKAADLAGAKVDMRQIGARDRAKLAGGYGICGRELCCANWLTTFPAISIRMAKEQDLPLNPQKISGLCGRLLCCLSYEEQGYREMRRTLPKLGQRCSTPTGEGKVIAVNILRRQVSLVVEGERIDVGDRDLGTVVRWDPAAKNADPPPSISRADAIATGMIEADERDLAGEDEDVEPPFGLGSGRLPRQQTRRSPPPPREVVEPAQLPEGRRRDRGPALPARPPEPGQPAGEVAGAQQRPFQRRGEPPPEPAQPAPEGGETPGPARRRRGRRGGRGRGAGEGARPTPPPE